MKDMNRKHQLLSIQEAAERLGISVFTLRTWVSQRRVEFIKMGRRVLFHPDALDRKIQACTVGESRPRSTP